MAGAVGILIASTLVLAAWMVVHVVVLLEVRAAEAIEPKWKWWSLVPPVAPFVAWRARARVSAVLWGVLALAYVTLRVVANAVD